MFDALDDESSAVLPAFNDIRDFFNRGITIRSHPSGIEVFMFKDRPGYYYDSRGKEVAANFAQQAGFDVVRHGKDRLLRERMASVESAMRAELEAAEVDDKQVVMELNGLRLVAISNGRHYIEDEDGRKITKQFLTEEEGKRIMQAMAPAPAPEEAPKEPLKGALPPVKEVLKAKEAK